VRVEFTHSGTRTCPVSRNEHRSNHFNVVLRADERTGLPAFFVYCHSSKDGCKAAGHRMLSFLREDEAAEVCAEAGLALSSAVQSPPTLGQAAVAIGESQKALDRLLENPRGGWATVDNLSAIACALCAASGGHAGFTTSARLMLDGVLDATTLTGPERSFVRRAFQMPKEPLDPVATLRGFAAGLNGKREQELMVIREAIVANTHPALEASVAKAAEALLVVLEYCERKDSHGKVQSLSNIADLGMFLYYIWRRVARYGFDRTQSSETHQWMFYLFNGATYERGQWKQLAIRAEKHMRSVIAALSTSTQLESRAMSLDVKCNTSDLIAKALAKMQMSFMDVEQLRVCGLVSPNEFEREMDMGNFIGFTNGVYDILSDVFMPMGSVPLNVVVSMCTNYDYVSPDDPLFPRRRAEIEEFYRKLHADDYQNPNDERLAAMWLLAGSLLFRGNVCKKAYVFLGSEGDNGKSTFTELIQLTLGDYAVTGNRSSLSGTQEQMTLDPDLVANHKSLVCTFPEVQSVESGGSAGFKFNCGKLKALTGQDEQSVRGLYRDKKGIIIGFKPILHSNYMPQVDSDDSAARNRLWVARFGATFPAGLTEPDAQRRRFPRIENLRDTMRAWAPFHFLLMLEALRDFRRRNCVLPVGAQQIEGSLMHQEVVAQTPEGKLRAWVEEHYSHVPLREKDTGTKLEALYATYASCVPPVHAKVLGKILFAKLLNSVYPNIGPHKNANHTANGIYLLR
jgi:phage/plasmid-associated DNA primase